MTCVGGSTRCRPFSRGLKCKHPDVAATTWGDVNSPPGKSRSIDLSKIHYRKAKSHGTPDIFDWFAERELRARDPVARRIAQRFGVSIYHARIIARASGLGEQTR